MEHTLTQYINKWLKRHPERWDTHMFRVAHQLPNTVSTATITLISTKAFTPYTQTTKTKRSEYYGNYRSRPQEASSEYWKLRQFIDTCTTVFGKSLPLFIQICPISEYFGKWLPIFIQILPDLNNYGICFQTSTLEVKWPTILEVIFRNIQILGKSE